MNNQILSKFDPKSIPMKHFMLLSAVCFATFANAQNIVANPNFSLYSTCPDYFSELNYSTGWHTATASTPDYFNVCDSTSTTYRFGVPVNDFGIQPAAGGAYAGFYAYFGGGPEYREYIGTTIPALEPGAYYRVCIRVSLAGHSEFGCDGIGAFFYINALPDTLSHTVVPSIPQINYSSYGTLTDTTNWIMLTGFFAPDSAYTHLALGNFKADSLTHLAVASSSSEGYAYYYIDSVAVEKTRDASVGSANTPLQANLYPNPFTDHATLTFSNPYRKNHTLSIYDVSGVVVRKN